MAFWDKWFGKGDSGSAPSVTSNVVSSGTSDLDAAVATGNLYDIMKALNSGADPNVKNTGGNTPLQVAVMTGNKDMIKLLIDAGGNVDVFNQAAADAAIAATGPAAPALDVPGTGDPVATDDDIQVRKPLTFKRKA